MAFGTCSDAEGEQFLDKYYEGGGNFIDTANNYQNGEVRVVAEASLLTHFELRGAERDPHWSVGRCQEEPR